MLKGNKEYLSEIYQKIDNRVKDIEFQSKRKLNLKTITTAISSAIIILGVSLTVYATLGGTIGGKPVLDWFGIDFSDRYSEYVVPVENESIETDGANLSLVGTVCDAGFITFEFDLTLNENAKNKLGSVKKMSEREGGAESLVVSFNNRNGTDTHNSSIQIDGKFYDLRSPQRYQQVIKISDYEYKIYQMYFLTDSELQGKTDFTVTLDSISIVNMNDQKDFKPRVRGYKKETEGIEEILYKSGINQSIDEILKDYDDNSTYLQIKNDANIPDFLKELFQYAWYAEGHYRLLDTQTGLKTLIKNYKTEGSTIEDVLKEHGIEEDVETILVRYPDSITVDEVLEDYYSDYGSFRENMYEARENYLSNRDSDFYLKEYAKAQEEYIKAVDKIDREMSPERKAERKEIEVLLYLYYEAEGLSQRDIIIDGSFNINLSKKLVLKDTNVVPPDSHTATYKKMTIKADKVMVSPIQTIVTLTSTINDASSESMTNGNHKDFIGLTRYDVYDDKGNLLVNLQFEEKRTVVLEDGKTIEWYSDDIVNNLTFSNSTMILKNHIAIRTDDNIGSIKIEPYVQELDGSLNYLEPIIVKLK